jgi:hypothetical protein
MPALAHGVHWLAGMNTTENFTRLEYHVEDSAEHDRAAKDLANAGWTFRFRLGYVRSGNGRSIWTKGRIAYVVTARLPRHLGK